MKRFAVLSVLAALVLAVVCLKVSTVDDRDQGAGTPSAMNPRPAAVDMSGSRAIAEAPADVEPQATGASQGTTPEAALSEADADRSLAIYSAINRWRPSRAPCWGLGQTVPGDFVTVNDPSAHTSGQSSVSLTSNHDSADSGMLHQRIEAGELRGKTVEFAADLRTADVTHGANLFVRADDASGNAVAIETVMENAAPKDGIDEHLAVHRVDGTTGWTTRRVVLRIPEHAAFISYGVALHGAGRVWIDNASLMAANAEAQITGFSRTKAALEMAGVLIPDHVLTGPQNLDFEPEDLEEKCRPEASREAPKPAAKSYFTL